MITAAFALLSAVGAWLAWRHNPLYSARSALRILVTLCVLIIAMIGLIVVIVDHLDGRPVWVQVVMLASVIVVGTLGMIFGVMKFATPGAILTTALPPTVAVVTIHRRRILPWLKRGGIVLAVILLLCLVPGPVRDLAACCAAILGLMGIIMVPTAYWTGLQLDRAVTALQLHPWVHWRYPTDAWNVWCDSQATQQAAEQAVKMSPKQRRYTYTLITLFGMGYAGYLTPAGPEARIGGALATGAFVSVLLLLTTPIAKGTGARLAKQMKASPHETYFGQDGVLCNGVFCRWLSADAFLSSASVESGSPASIQLRFKQIAPSAYGAPSVLHLTQNVLIPANAAATDLSVLQAALTERCPSASVHLA